MSTPTLINSGSIFNNANGSIVVTLPSTPSLVINTYALTANTPANLVNIVVMSGGGGSSKLRNLTDVVGANTAQDGYVLQYDTHGTANTADDTFDVVPNNLDGGAF
jgi:hypothetical protein